MPCCGRWTVLQRDKYVLYGIGIVIQLFRLALLWLLMVMMRRLVLVGVDGSDSVFTQVSSFWRGFFLDELEFEAIIALIATLIGVDCALIVVWKYLMKRRAANLSKRLHFRLQQQFTQPFISDDQSNQEEVLSAIFSDLPKVEEYEDNIRFYLFTEMFFIILAVIFLFIVSWKLALISIGLVAFVSIGEALFSSYFLQSIVDEKEHLKQEVSNDQINLFHLRELAIISRTQESEKKRLNEKLERIDGHVSSYLVRFSIFQFFKFYFISIIGAILVIFTYYTDPDIDSVFATFVCVTVLWEVRSSVVSVEFMRPIELDVWAAVIKCEAILEEEEREREGEGEGESWCCGGRGGGREKRERGEEGEEVVVEMGPIKGGLMEEESFEEEDKSAMTFNKSLCLRDAELSYMTSEGDVKIVQTNFDLCIQKGEIVGLVGETGCGKSTILRHLMGLMAPAKGNLVIDGREITKKNIDEYLAKITAVFQFSHFFRRTISENVSYGYSGEIDNNNSHLVEKSLEKAHLLEFAKSFDEGIDTKLDQGEHTLSGGQRQRLQLARMFAHGEDQEKEIVFVDEPTSSLDPKTVETILPEFREFLEGRTCVIISHDINLLNQICTRIVQINPLNDGAPPSPPPPGPPKTPPFAAISGTLGTFSMRESRKGTFSMKG